MNKPCLIIMAAGLGSRYGGLKQIDPVDAHGCAIIDYSIFDATRAGFEQVILVIKPELEQDFDETVVKRLAGRVKIQYAYQSLNDVPAGIAVPEERSKPWGTAHAVLSARKLVNGPFAAINADDFYGRHAYAQIFDFLSRQTADTAHAMIGYRLKNTITEHGYVSRGVCQVDANGHLTEITERLRIEKTGNGIGYTEDSGNTHVVLPPDTLVSMNMWGFGASMMVELENRFKQYLLTHLKTNPLKCEYFLPYVPDCLIKEHLATVSVLPNEDKWYGVTYAEDMPIVKAAIQQMRQEGIYPQNLWN